MRCPECDAKMVPQSGCRNCPVCGYSYCCAVRMGKNKAAVGCGPK